MPDGFQQIGMSILKLFHLVLGILKTVKGKQLLQGACLKQMATSQLTGKVASQVKSSDLASKPLVKCREMRTVSALEEKLLL